jgi:hypothetical protein
LWKIQKTALSGILKTDFKTE